MRLGVKDVEQLLIASEAPPKVAAAWAAPMLTCLPLAGCNTVIRIAHFMAQVSHESGRFRFVKEVWGPTAAQKTYEGRKNLGNTESGDGKRFLGRGIIQLTGRYNYTRFNEWLNKNGYRVNVVKYPTLVEDMPYAMLTAVYYWRFHPKARGIVDMNVVADGGSKVSDVQAVTRLVNGGLNGFNHRWQVFEKALIHLVDRKDFQGRTTPVLFGPMPETKKVAPKPVAPVPSQNDTFAYHLERAIQLLKA